jgi:SAM-dependent methyltransferase
MNEFRFACPTCQTPLIAVDAVRLACPTEGIAYECCEGIWRFLTSKRQAQYEQFMREYQIVRRAEQRGSTDSAYYRALPFVDLTGRFSHDWQIRSRSYRAFERYSLLPLERTVHRPLHVLDLGAGNGWLSYRLAQRGHAAAAVDLTTDALDGLGAYVHYDAAYVSIQADFDHLPLLDEQVDMVIFNASLHYSTNYQVTLSEALRVLRASGQVVILDSPVYRSPDSGRQMVREREVAFERQYGFPSNAIPSENYLTYQRLRILAETLDVDWRFVRPFYGWDWVIVAGQKRGDRQRSAN